MNKIFLHPTKSMVWKNLLHGVGGKFSSRCKKNDGKAVEIGRQINYYR